MFVLNHRFLYLHGNNNKQTTTHKMNKMNKCRQPNLTPKILSNKKKKLTANKARIITISIS